MEHQLWKAIVALLAPLDKTPRRTRCGFSDKDIVKIYYWAVIWNRPTSWACQKQSWPPHLRKQSLPSASTMSRRLKTQSVLTMLDGLEKHVVAPSEASIFWMIDGKPLPIGGCSKDHEAGYGKAAGTKAKGYKLHALIRSDGAVAEWRVAPMNKDERVMAELIFNAAPPEVCGYIVADSNYDSNKLHAVCDKRQNTQLVTRRRYGPGNGTGHRPQTPGRLRSIALTESPFSGLGQRLLQDRRAIEREYGNLTNWSAGLTGLPAWIRTERRVRVWVQAKLVLLGIKRKYLRRTYVA